MFTGIIQAIGKVVKSEKNRLWIHTSFKKIQPGESISIDGVCLTVARQRGPALGFDIGPETARVTTLGALRASGRVNLERALRYGNRMGGHWLTGHVEETGRIRKFERAGRNRWLTIDAPRSVGRYSIPKGSMAVDGISLTIVSNHGKTIKFMIIPHTLSHTTLGLKKPGDRVNLEPDLLAKYAKGVASFPRRRESIHKRHDGSPAYNRGG